MFTPTSMQNSTNFDRQSRSLFISLWSCCWWGSVTFDLAQHAQRALRCAICLLTNYSSLSCYVVAACNAETYRLLYVFCGSRQQQSLAAGIFERNLSKWDKLFQVARGGGCVPHYPDKWPLALGSQNIEGCKKFFCNVFLQGGFTYLDEIRHGVAGLKWFLVNFGPFFRGAQIFYHRYLGHFLLNRHKILHGLGVWPMDISSLNFVNFDSGVRQCHASVRHWCICYHYFYNH